MSDYLAFLAAMLTFALLRELGITDLFHWCARHLRGWKRISGGAWGRWAPGWWPWE